MNQKRLAVQDFLQQASSIPMLDVRSPKEYHLGHIPSALSFPLFSNDERAVVGTLYKQKGRHPAIKKGLEIIGPKMVDFIEQAEALQSDQLALYCWRGGMRSDSMAWLLERYDLETILLEGGYKAFRRHLLAFFDQPLPLRVITGYTGSQKTRLLHLLKEKGAQVVDLEGLAQHQGSSFGNKKSTGQPSTEQFQNLLFEAFRSLDLHRPIWIEDEDMRIGTVNMMDNLFRQISSSPHFFIEINKAERAEFLVKDYSDLTKDQLINATRAIRKRLGYDRADQAIAMIEEGQLKEAAQIILCYYDTRYDRSIARKKEQIAERFSINSKELPILADELIKRSKNGI